MRENSQSIDGLEWEDLWSINNGGESAVIPIPSLRPTNIVFKGDSDFSYGHYGVHLGQSDRLIFIGPSHNTITAHFIDCRRASPTFTTRVVQTFQPSSTRLLNIPPGVAHTFDTRAVSTLNLYGMRLPEPERWLNGSSEWTVEGDITNVRMDVADAELPSLEPNSLVAGELFFKLVAEEQRRTLGALSHEYPFTQKVQFDNGQHEHLKFWKRLGRHQTTDPWTPFPIHGAGWKGNLTVWTGEVSGYVPLLDRRPKHLIDHGEKLYSHDAYGIHLGGDDHLVFIGPSANRAKCELVDCRRNSPTLHSSFTFDFTPDPLRTLIIPRGVAHRFEHMEGIFTINQPLTFLDQGSEYQPGHDVIDWPIDHRPFPILDTNDSPAPESFYEELSEAQKSMTATPPTHATPFVLLMADGDGKSKRVVLRAKHGSKHTLPG